ncbi:helix-turn-helix domain-containing protein [Microbacterium neimengense]
MPSQRKNAVRLYEDGETIDTIAAKLGASYGGGREALVGPEVALRSPGRRHSS